MWEAPQELAVLPARLPRRGARGRSLRRDRAACSGRRAVRPGTTTSRPRGSSADGLLRPALPDEASCSPRTTTVGCAISGSRCSIRSASAERAVASSAPTPKTASSRAASASSDSGSRAASRSPPRSWWRAPRRSRIDGRADQHHRSHPLRQTHGELGDDLAAHRVRHERWTLEPGRVQPAGERGGELGNAERRARPLATPVPRQVGCEHGEGRGERLREREHVACPRRRTRARARRALLPRPRACGRAVRLPRTTGSQSTRTQRLGQPDMARRQRPVRPSGSRSRSRRIPPCRPIYNGADGVARAHRLSPRLLRRRRAGGRDGRARARDLRAAHLRPQADRPQRARRP